MNNNLTFDFTFEQTNLILAALGRMPYEAVAPLVAEIQRQAQPQLANMPKAEDDTSTAEKG